MVTRLNEYLNAVSVFDRVEVGLLSFSRSQVRKVRDEDLSDLMASIREHGLLEPIIVRPKGKGFEVIAGNRRLRACKLLRFRRMNCIVADLNDAEAYEVSIIENVQRSTLNPLEEAMAFKKYCDEFGWGSQTRLAKKVGKSQEYISHRLKLLELPEEVKEELLNGKVSPTTALEMVWLKTDSCRLAAMEMVKESGLNSRSVRKLVHDLNLPDEQRVGAGFEVSPDDRESSHGKSYLEEAVLILRISLARLDWMVAKVQEPQMKSVLLAKRHDLNKIVDDLIQLKMIGVYQARQVPVIAARAGPRL
jgi:ParB family transcriptional regulator, chromosome partitioning protein